MKSPTDKQFGHFFTTTIPKFLLLRFQMVPNVTGTHCLHKTHTILIHSTLAVAYEKKNMCQIEWLQEGSYEIHSREENRK